MFQAKRRRLFVDPTVQGAFLVRAMFYWLGCVLCLVMTLFCGSLLPQPAASFHAYVNSDWFRFVPAIVLVLGLLPAMAFDMVRLTNRMVGPMVRLRRAMRGAAQGESISPLRFREGDFWRDFAEEFNAILARLHEIEAAREAAAAASPVDNELVKVASR